MILKFSCRNFRSIREKQELSLVATKTRTDEKPEVLIKTPASDLQLLRCAALYGPNASGKSNVLDALASFGRFISDSWRVWKPNGPIPEYDPFWLDHTSRQSDTEFEITFLLDSEIFQYGFRFDRNRILEESLTNITGVNKILFHRSTESDSIRFPNKNLGKTADERRHLDSIERDVRPNSLFLSAAAQKAHPLLSSIYSRLSDDFKPIHLKNMQARQRYTASECTDAKFKARVVTLLRFADSGIVDMEVFQHEISDDERRKLRAIIMAMQEADSEKQLDRPIDEPDFPAVPEIRLAHRGEGGEKFLLAESQQSDGTQAFLAMLGPILDALDTGSVLLIDELETSLHPKLQRELVRIFNLPELNPKGAQFIFTTHNTNLLDLELLRRDQIWFTEKSAEGATRLFPLTDYKPRTNQNIEAAYLGGRFGAIPFLDDEFLKELLTTGDETQSSLEFPAENSK